MFKIIADKFQRTYGLALRVFGIDISILTVWWLNDWRIIDLRIPCNQGVYLQVWFALISVGRLADDSIYKDRSI